MAIVIGKRGKNIPADQVRHYVWGVTLFHDWSIRDGGGTDRAVSYNLQKNFAGAASMGPCIVVGELDPQNVDIETRVNGSVRQVTIPEKWSGPLARYWNSFPKTHLCGGRRDRRRNVRRHAADQSRRSEGKRPLDLLLKIGDVVEVSSPQDRRIIERSRHQWIRITDSWA